MIPTKIYPTITMHQPIHRHTIQPSHSPSHTLSGGEARQRKDLSAIVLHEIHSLHTAKVRATEGSHLIAPLVSRNTSRNTVGVVLDRGVRQEWGAVFGVEGEEDASIGGLGVGGRAIGQDGVDAVAGRGGGSIAGLEDCSGVRGDGEGGDESGGDDLHVDC